MPKYDFFIDETSLSRLIPDHLSIMNDVFLFLSNNEIAQCTGALHGGFGPYPAMLSQPYPGVSGQK
jgi:hypothetical protein